MFEDQGIRLVMFPPSKGVRHWIGLAVSSGGSVEVVIADRPQRKPLDHLLRSTTSNGSEPSPVSGVRAVENIVVEYVVMPVELRRVQAAIAALRRAAVSGLPESSTASATASPATRSCGLQSFGKGWYLRATRSVSCREARAVFRAFFSTHGCSGPCSVRGYRCRPDYSDDVERVRCTQSARLVVFRSLP
jgi:hypothetical protein